MENKNDCCIRVLNDIVVIWVYNERRDTSFSLLVHLHIYSHVRPAMFASLTVPVSSSPISNRCASIKPPASSGRLSARERDSKDGEKMTATAAVVCRCGDTALILAW